MWIVMHCLICTVIWNLCYSYEGASMWPWNCEELELM